MKLSLFFYIIFLTILVHGNEKKDVDGITEVFYCYKTISGTTVVNFVKSFKIHKINHLSCQEKYLPVFFNYVFANDSSATAQAYLKPDAKGCIGTEQITSKECPRLKRYVVELKTIVILNNIAEVVLNENVDSYISKELWALSYYTWLIFKLGIYDEETDSIMIWKFLQAYQIIGIVIGFLLYYLYDFYHKFVIFYSKCRKIYDSMNGENAEKKDDDKKENPKRK